MTESINEFWEKYKQDIGETLEDFTSDYHTWLTHHPNQTFTQYAEQRIREWMRIAEKEKFTFTRK